jgi:GNAT superfamily N-acetyltransferase
VLPGPTLLCVDIREIDRRDEPLVRRHWEIGKAAEAGRPYDFYAPWETAWLSISEGRDDFEMVMLGAFVDDQMWGTARVDHPLHDNLHSASVEVHVHPDRQRRGLGRALSAAADEVARARGRRVMMSEAFAPPDADSPGLLFGRALGFKPAIEDGMKVVDLHKTEELWSGLEARTAPRHTDYRIVTWQHTVPEEYVDDYCRLNELFFDEAPMGELEVEPEKWDADRVKKREELHRRTGRHEFTAGAVTLDGRLVGLTEVMVNERVTWRGFQSGTLVDPEHRGHSLGLAIKLANHRQIRATYPDCRILLTGNADVNASMNAVNDALGYREVERCVEMQKDI